MNIAIIFAGGTGQRMTSSTLPKQFMKHRNKPILVYTLEKFQAHEKIEGIIIVMLEAWIGHTENLVQNYGLTKVKAIIPGGETGQESIYYGVKKAAAMFPEDSIVLIHDGVRPLIDAGTITRALACAKEKGSAITTAPAIETITLSDAEGKVGEIIDRSRCQMARAPQCFRLGELFMAHQKARADNKNDFIDSASLMRYYGYPLYSIEGPAENIKITTLIDYAMFCAIVDTQTGKEKNEHRV